MRTRRARPRPARALKGGGSRARKAERRMPRTVEALKRAWDAASPAWRKGHSIEDASWQKNNGAIVKYKAKILPETIAPGKGCVYFVTKAEGELDHNLKAKPYEATKLCKGGTALTGFAQYADRDLAARVVKDRADWERKRRATLAIYK